MRGPETLFARGVARLVAVLVAAASLAPALAPGASADSSSAQDAERFVVGGGRGTADAIARAGGLVLAMWADAELLVAEAPPGVDLPASLARDETIAFVERAGASLASASWDGASWDGAAWDGAAWDGAAWDGAAWDGAAWDGAAWDGAAWDGDGSEQVGPVPPWGLSAIGAPAAWREVPAPERTQLVCLVDSGVDASHPSLASALHRGADGEPGASFVPGDDTLDDPAGHGTHLVGIVAAEPHAGSGFAGVARPFVAVAKAFDATGRAETASVILGVRWCVEQDADVVLLAFTEDAPTRALREAVRAAQRAGALVVAAAGNAGPCGDCIGSPASLPGVLAVGAARPDGTPAAFSASGHRLDLLAPGVVVASTFPGGGFRAASGTSQAAAFAAGAAAYVGALHPAWDGDRIARTLTSSAHREPGGRDADDGWGRLDLAAAVGAR